MRAVRVLASVLALQGLMACSEPPPAVVVSPAAAVITPSPAVPEQDLYLLAVGGNGFRPSMTMADLKTRFGDDKVVPDQVPLGEGQTEPGALIYPDDPSRRAYVHFVDGHPEGTISAIYVRGLESIWRGPLGLRLGISSIDLERINGRSFRFLGFGWDYAGYVSNWADGNLAHALLAPGQLALRLEPPALAPGEVLPAAYPMGEAEAASDLAIVRKLPPVLVEMGLAFVPAAVDTAKPDTR